MVSDSGRRHLDGGFYRYQNWTGCSLLQLLRSQAITIGLYLYRHRFGTCSDDVSQSHRIVGVKKSPNGVFLVAAFTFLDIASFVMPEQNLMLGLFVPLPSIFAGAWLFAGDLLELRA